MSLASLALSLALAAAPAMQSMPATAIEARPVGTKIDTIVLHHTVIDGPAEKTARFFADPKTVVSAHYVVGKDGTIIQCVPDDKLAHHAGVSSFGGRERVNEFSLGIEIVNLGDGVDPYPDAQYAALARLMAYLMETHGVGWERVTGHKFVARPAGRKNDPSPNFDFVRLKRETQAIAPQPGELTPDVARNSQPPMPPVADHARRVAIVGGGVAGLAAAYELVKLGFRDVTLFEADDAVGGKVRTYYHADRPYEVGAIVQSDAFHEIERLARETGYVRHWRTPYPAGASVIDRQGRVVAAYTGYREPGYGAWDDLRAIAPALQLDLDLHRSGLDNPGFEAVFARDPQFLRSLYQPTRDFMLQRGLGPLHGRYNLFFGLTGYGNTHEVPALYHLKFFDLVSRVGGIQWLGLGSGMTTAARGYQDLCEHVADWLRQRGVRLHLGERVEEVKRPPEGHWGEARKIRIETARRNAEYDALIVATSPVAARRYLRDATPLERRMLDPVRTYNFVTTIFEASPALAVRWGRQTVFFEDARHVIGFYNADGSNVFTAYQFAPADASNEAITATLKAEVGGVEQVLVQQAWRDYFPHYDSATLQSDGGRFLPEILDLQGERNTLYLTANYNFESTEHTAGFARGMIRRFFR